MSYSTMSLVDVLDAFASNEPVPGGGSAAALAGALGTALLVMVAGLPKTLTGSPEEVADLAAAGARLRPILEQLTMLVDADSAAYRAVVAAMRLPKGSDAEVAARRGAIDTAMRGAIDVPMDTMRYCQQALRGAVIVAHNGNRNAATDTGIGVDLLQSAVRGAGLNVDVNLRSVSDAAFVERVVAERAQLETEADADARRARDQLSSI
jgi:formiminotetrahydrofolate cyclodeaminase